MKRAVLVSFFLSTNIGDLAISSVVAKQVSDAGFEITAFDFPTMSRVSVDTEGFRDIIAQSYRPECGRFIRRAMRRVLRAVRDPVLAEAWFRDSSNCESVPADLLQTVQESDVLVLAGGNMIMDLCVSWPVIFAQYCNAARAVGIPVYVLYVGAGPIKYRTSYEVFGKALKIATKISVRDPNSLNLLAELMGGCCPDNLVITCDPVFSIDLNRLGVLEDGFPLLKGQTTAAVCVLGKECFEYERQWYDYIDAISDLLTVMNRRFDGSIQFALFSTEQKDYEAVHGLARVIRSREAVNCRVERIHSAEELLRFYSGCNYLVGGRMHSLIFAQVSLLPYIGIVWQPKLDGFAHTASSSSHMFSVSQLRDRQEEVIVLVENEIASSETRIRGMEVINQRLIELVSSGGLPSNM